MKKLIKDSNLPDDSIYHSNSDIQNYENNLTESDNTSDTELNNETNITPPMDQVDQFEFNKNSTRSPASINSSLSNQLSNNTSIKQQPTQQQQLSQSQAHSSIKLGKLSSLKSKIKTQASSIIIPNFTKSNEKSSMINQSNKNSNMQSNIQSPLLPTLSPLPLPQSRSQSPPLPATITTTIPQTNVKSSPDSHIDNENPFKVQTRKNYRNRLTTNSLLIPKYISRKYRSVSSNDSKQNDSNNNLNRNTSHISFVPSAQSPTLPPNSPSISSPTSSPSIQSELMAQSPILNNLAEEFENTFTDSVCEEQVNAIHAPNKDTVKEQIENPSAPEVPEIPLPVPISVSPESNSRNSQFNSITTDAYYSNNNEITLDNDESNITKKLINKHKKSKSVSDYSQLENYLRVTSMPSSSPSPKLLPLGYNNYNIKNDISHRHTSSYDSLSSQASRMTKTNLDDKIDNDTVKVENNDEKSSSTFASRIKSRTRSFLFLDSLISSPKDSQEISTSVTPKIQLESESSSPEKSSTTSTTDNKSGPQISPSNTTLHNSIVDFSKSSNSPSKSLTTLPISSETNTLDPITSSAIPSNTVKYRLPSIATLTKNLLSSSSSITDNSRPNIRRSLSYHSQTNNENHDDDDEEDEHTVQRNVNKDEIETSADYDSLNDSDCYEDAKSQDSNISKKTLNADTSLPITGQQGITLQITTSPILNTNSKFSVVSPKPNKFNSLINTSKIDDKVNFLEPSNRLRNSISPTSISRQRSKTLNALDNVNISKENRPTTLLSDIVTNNDSSNDMKNKNGSNYDANNNNNDDRRNSALAEHAKMFMRTSSKSSNVFSFSSITNLVKARKHSSSNASTSTVNSSVSFIPPSPSSLEFGNSSQRSSEVNLKNTNDQYVLNPNLESSDVSQASSPNINSFPMSASSCNDKSSSSSLSLKSSSSTKKKLNTKPLKNESANSYLERLLEILPVTQILATLSKYEDEISKEASFEFLNRFFNFDNEPIDMSLRKFLMINELPKESQQIDRVIYYFGKHYHNCHRSMGLTSDICYIITFSLIMLHTDRFNPNNKRKMSKLEFIVNVLSAIEDDYKREVEMFEKNEDNKGLRFDSLNIQDISSEFVKSSLKDILGYYFDNITYTPFVRCANETSAEIMNSLKDHSLPLPYPYNSVFQQPSKSISKQTSSNSSASSIVLNNSTMPMIRKKSSSILWSSLPLDPYDYITKGTIDELKLQLPLSYQNPFIRLEQDIKTTPRKIRKGSHQRALSDFDISEIPDNKWISDKLVNASNELDERFYNNIRTRLTGSHCSMILKVLKSKASFIFKQKIEIVDYEFQLANKDASKSNRESIIQESNGKSKQKDIGEASKRDFGGILDTISPLDDSVAVENHDSELGEPFPTNDEKAIDNEYYILRIFKIGIVSRQESQKLSSVKVWKNYFCLLTSIGLLFFKNISIFKMTYVAENDGTSEYDNQAGSDLQRRDSEKVIILEEKSQNVSMSASLLENFDPSFIIPISDVFATRTFRNLDIDKSLAERGSNATYGSSSKRPDALKTRSFMIYGKNSKNIYSVDNKYELKSWINSINYVSALSSCKWKNFKKLSVARVLYEKDKECDENNSYKELVDKRTMELTTKLKNIRETASTHTKDLKDYLYTVRRLHILTPFNPKTKENIISSVKLFNSKIEWLWFDLQRAKGFERIICYELECQKKESELTRSKNITDRNNHNDTNDSDKSPNINNPNPANEDTSNTKAGDELPPNFAWSKNDSKLEQSLSPSLDQQAITPPTNPPRSHKYGNEDHSISTLNIISISADLTSAQSADGANSTPKIGGLDFKAAEVTDSETSESDIFQMTDKPKIEI